MLAIVNTASHGFDKIFVSFNGTSIELQNGQTVTNAELIKAHPKYFHILKDIEVKPVEEIVTPVVEPVTPVIETVSEESKEEILTEDSAEVTTEVVEETPVEEPVVTTKGRKKSK